MDNMRIFRGCVSTAFLILIMSASLSADVTYWLDSSAYNNAEVKASIEEAVPIYNKYGSFNKHLSVYYNSGIPTAEANYDGYIGFGGIRNTRVALHEMGHTVGMGTFYNWEPTYGTLIAGGAWGGFYGWKKAVELGNGGLWGDGHAIWPGGMNYDNEDTSFMDRIKHVHIMAAMRCDMGIMSYSKEAEHQVVPLGDTAIFGVASPVATSYQWYKNGVALIDGGDISGATRPILQIANVNAADVGSYYCVVTGAGETLNSRVRRLSIQGQVGQWDFENNANDSVGSYDGTPTGSPAYTTGKVGTKAIDLDGIDDFVTLPEGVADAKDMTVAVWVYWDGGNPWQRIFDFGASTSNFMCLTPRSGDNTLRLAIKNGGSEQIAETSQLATGQWVHVAVTLRNDTAILYVNGKPVASNGNVTIDPADLLANRNYIGDSQFSADPFFNGRIDDFRIYNYALPGSEIWNLWGQNANNPPVFDAEPLILSDGHENNTYNGVTLADYASDPDSDPLTFSKVSGPAWLSVAANGSLSGMPGTADRGENTFVVRVTDTSGATDDVTMHITIYGSADVHYEFENNVNDSTGSNHGTATGSPAYTTGKVGLKAIDLDGVNDYVTLPAGIANTENITVAAWVNWDGGNQWQRIFDFGNNTDRYMMLTPRSGNNKLLFSITGTGGGSGEQKLETSQLPIGYWAHVAITLSRNTGRLYVNGQLKDINTAMTINPSDFNPSNNLIGDSQFTSDPLFDGRIDEFRIYNYALSDAQIAILAGEDISPSFTSDPIVNLDAIEWSDYSGTGTSLAAYTNAPLGIEGVTFSKESGPDWLGVASDGTLSGIPDDSDVGENVFTVLAKDVFGQYDYAAMTIQVANIYSGIRGTEDLAGLAAQWLMTDCADTPACDGADLDGDNDVTFADFWMLAYNWLVDYDLQLHLKFDEMTGDLAGDTSIYDRPGQLVNAPAWSAGHDPNYGALTFDGSNYVEVAHDAGLNPNADSFSVAFWMKSDTASQGALIVSKRQSTTPYPGYLIGLSNGSPTIFTPGSRLTFLFGADSGDRKGGYTTSNIVFNEWTHVCVVLNQDADTTYIYINGAEVPIIRTPDDTLPTISNTTPVYIGKNPGVSTKPYYGLVDDVRIYNIALSEQQVQSILNP